jgi:hypothetical protein
MRLSVKACAGACGAVWGAGVLACGLINLASPGYGRGFLKMLQSVYPGFRFSRTVSDVLVGAGYAVLDGATAGALYAVLYNRLREGNQQARETYEAVMEPIAK